MGYLKNAIPKSLDYLMVGVRDVKTAWERLYDRFGDDRLRVRALYDQLLKLELKGKEYERLERLYFEVENSCKMAEQMGAGEVFGNDMYVVAGLLDKLAASSVDKWIEFAEEQPQAVITGRNEWDVFRQWLLICYRKAKRARLTAQAAPRGQTQSGAAKSTAAGQAASKPVVLCSRCREPGHRRENCPQPATAASLNMIEAEYQHMCDMAVAFATDSDRVAAFKDAEKRFVR